MKVGVEAVVGVGVEVWFGVGADTGAVVGVVVVVGVANGRVRVVATFAAEMMQQMEQEWEPGETRLVSALTLW